MLAHPISTSSSSSSLNFAAELHAQAPLIITPHPPHLITLLQVELQEVVDFFRQPERFRASGSRIPRGVLLCGPPGTGKTLLARWVVGGEGGRVGWLGG